MPNWDLDDPSSGPIAWKYAQEKVAMAKTTRVKTIVLSDDDLSACVLPWARAAGLVEGGETAHVHISVRTRTEGYGTAERDTYYAEVTLTVKA